jgi:hypothetical protein
MGHFQLDILAQVFTPLSHVLSKSYALFLMIYER